MLGKRELAKLSLRELETLEKDVASAKAKAKERQLQEARDEVSKIARDHGFTLNELLDGKGKGRGGASKKRKKRATAPKFKHPENPDVTWTGMGRKPKWFVEHLDRGGKEEDLLIAA